jgi:hypothetical protein
MPIPAKPCEGRFSEEVLLVLSRNRDRDQWANHRCEVCGLEVGAKMEKGKWVPEQHWPSVKYQPRNAAGKKRSASAENAPADNADNIESNDAGVLAGTGPGGIHLMRS